MPKARKKKDTKSVDNKSDIKKSKTSKKVCSSKKTEDITEPNMSSKLDDKVDNTDVADRDTPLTSGLETKKFRQTLTRETALAAFDELLEIVDEEIQRLREVSSKNNGVKFLRSVNKRVKSLKTQTSRLMKPKTKTLRKGNNSGFQKPVKISQELAKFAGWSENELKSRVEVTKYICDYIAKHDLQNPNDRRQIKPDAKLQKLLGYNPKKDVEPLRYYSIQSQLKKQNHFPN